MFMTTLTLGRTTRTRVWGVGVESGSLGPKVLVVDSPEMWNFYRQVVSGLVDRQDLILTQFLTEGERVYKQKRPFDAHVINPALNAGTERHLKNGLDLAKIIGQEENLQAVWLLCSDARTLDMAVWEGFTRVYFNLDVSVGEYPSKNDFARDFREEMQYGRRSL